jgi:chaperonin GroES
MDAQRINMKLRLLGERVLVKPLQQEAMLGFYMPESSKEKPTTGKVIAIGDGLVGDKKIEMKIKVNDTIVFQKWASNQEIKMQIEGKDENYIILKYSDILGVEE